MESSDEDMSQPSPQPPPPPDIDGKQTTLDKFVALIYKDPNQRPDFECHEFIPFLKKHIDWFKDLKPEIIQDIIKRCKLLRLPPEAVFIKQGDMGDSMYAILRGEVGVHVFFDSENERECLTRVDAAVNKKKFNKNDLGNEVAQMKVGSCIGEVALLNDTCTRTASCVTTTACDFLVIDKALYSVSVKEFIEKEFRDKTEFVEKNPLFKSWTPRQRNQLAISLKKTRIYFGEKLLRQGQEVEDIFFIYKGDVEIHIDSRQYEKQFPLFHSEMKTLLPELNKSPRLPSQAPSTQRKERMAAFRAQKICILGANETIGSLEVILGLDSYMETVVAPGECELFMLKKSQFERSFKRKTAAATMEKLKEALANKLCLYIYQSDPSNVAFLKFLNIKLMDAQVLHEVKKSKNGRSKEGAHNIGAERTTKSVEEQEIVNIMKKLHMDTDRAAELPKEDMSEIALAKMDRRLRMWSESSHMNGSKLDSLQSSNIILSKHSEIA